MSRTHLAVRAVLCLAPHLTPEEHRRAVDALLALLGDPPSREPLWEPRDEGAPPTPAPGDLKQADIDMARVVGGHRRWLLDNPAIASAHNAADCAWCVAPASPTETPSTMRPGQRCTFASGHVIRGVSAHSFDPGHERQWETNRFLRDESRCPYVEPPSRTEPGRPQHGGPLMTLTEVAEAEAGRPSPYDRIKCRAHREERDRAVEGYLADNPQPPASGPGLCGTCSGRGVVGKVCEPCGGRGLYGSRGTSTGCGFCGCTGRLLPTGTDNFPCPTCSGGRTPDRGRQR